MQDYKNGGLKIINCKNFMTALKSSWIRTLTFITVRRYRSRELFETQFGHNLQTIIILGLYFIDIFIKNK